MKGKAGLTFTAWALAVTIVAADQLSKFWVLAGLVPGASVRVLGPIHLTLVANRGVSFGLLQSHADWARWGLTAFEAAVALSLALWTFRLSRPLTAAAIGLIIGGAAGNLIDRIRLGAVTDFIDVQRLYFPWVFNIADSAITIGVILLLAEGFLTPEPRRPT